MKLAMVGLGRMGMNMAKRLLGGGHQVVAFDLNESAVKAAEEKGAMGAYTLEEAIQKRHRHWKFH